MTTLTGLLPTRIVGAGVGAAPATLGSARAATTTAPAPKRRRCMQTPSRNPLLATQTNPIIAVWSIINPGTVVRMDDQESAMVKRSARRFATRWARRNPRTVAKAAGTVASHPVRTMRFVGHARQAKEVASDPRAAPAASRGFGAVRDAGRAELARPRVVADPRRNGADAGELSTSESRSATRSAAPDHARRPHRGGGRRRLGRRHLDHFAKGVLKVMRSNTSP